LDESEDVGTLELAMDEMTEAVPEGSRVEDNNKRWVRMQFLGGDPPGIGWKRGDPPQTGRKSLDVRVENRPAKAPMEKKLGGVILSGSGRTGAQDGCGGQAHVVTLAGREAERVCPVDSKDGKVIDSVRGNHERSGQPSLE
jgi:hypothetical protein